MQKGFRSVPVVYVNGLQTQGISIISPISSVEFHLDTFFQVRQQGHYLSPLNETFTMQRNPLGYELEIEWDEYRDINVIHPCPSASIYLPRNVLHPQAGMPSRPQSKLSL